MKTYVELQTVGEPERIGSDNMTRNYVVETPTLATAILVANAWVAGYTSYWVEGPKWVLTSLGTHPKRGVTYETIPEVL